ncbi:MAG: hypothetical protein N4A50_04450 [Vallitalea sp.]|jgi:hypothetical protein|nr:hypothetical protein [Vallitalea sp.]
MKKILIFILLVSCQSKQNVDTNSAQDGITDSIISKKECVDNDRLSTTRTFTPFEIFLLKHVEEAALPLHPEYFKPFFKTSEGDPEKIINEKVKYKPLILTDNSYEFYDLRNGINKNPSIEDFGVGYGVAKVLDVNNLTSGSEAYDFSFLIPLCYSKVKCGYLVAYARTCWYMSPNAFVMGVFYSRDGDVLETQTLWNSFEVDGYHLEKTIVKHDSYVTKEVIVGYEYDESSTQKSSREERIKYYSIDKNMVALVKDSLIYHKDVTEEEINETVAAPTVSFDLFLQKNIEETELPIGEDKLKGFLKQDNNGCYAIDNEKVISKPLILTDNDYNFNALLDGISRKPKSQDYIGGFSSDVNYLTNGLRSFDFKFLIPLFYAKVKCGYLVCFARTCWFDNPNAIISGVFYNWNGELIDVVTLYGVSDIERCVSKTTEVSFDAFVRHSLVYVYNIKKPYKETFVKSYAIKSDDIIQMSDSLVSKEYLDFDNKYFDID